MSKNEYFCNECKDDPIGCELTVGDCDFHPALCPFKQGEGDVATKWKRKPLKSAVAAKTSLNKRSAAPKTTPKSAKRRLRTA